MPSNSHFEGVYTKLKIKMGPPLGPMIPNLFKIRLKVKTEPTSFQPVEQ